jgi:O-acetyl-ADP-ribose deacetylase (regulator of RNase III)
VITYVKGDLFESPAQTLVNTVNTVGVMGRGIALEFKRIYPEMFEEYRRLCEQRKLDIGQLHLFKSRHKWILNFPTKREWRQPSRVEYIKAGLSAFVSTYAAAGIRSVAFPPLGCGNGQLDFATDVRPLMETYLRALPIPVFVYPEKPAIHAPEHRDAKVVAEWLRSEPASLSFDEVWADIVETVEESPKFETATEGNPFSVEAVEDPPTLVISAGGKTYRLGHEDLLEFWQQLRQFGFTFRGVAPEHYRLSYLFPLFERLPYVRKVVVSASPEGLEKKNTSAVALQVVPPSKTDDPVGDLFVPRVNAG